MDAVSEALLTAQNKAQVLFQEVVDSGMIRAGRLAGQSPRG